MHTTAFLTAQTAQKEMSHFAKHIIESTASAIAVDEIAPQSGQQRLTAVFTATFPGKVLESSSKDDTITMLKSVGRRGSTQSFRQCAARSATDTPALKEYLPLADKASSLFASLAVIVRE